MEVERLIKVDEFVKALSLDVLCASSKTSWPIENADINRPGLQLAGHYDYFAKNCPQIFGNTEISYLNSLTPEVRHERLKMFFQTLTP